MRPESWDNEYRHFDSIVRTIVARAEGKEFSRDEINRLDSALMQSHQKIGEMVFASPVGAPNLEYQRFFDSVSDIYSAAHALLQQLRKGI